ncbi:hypothetical protein EV701_13242 [Chthoniobacter flavus]|uniref:alpha/beta hydrolase family protein n=1 Tax=Chthoniobacter flavus TaxID=191863 RepID=UPI00104EF8B9|nr:hypothetical protein [Chthoniobacter flavus]TCO85242.1 hypothetical protein EV701_13242 [Chthoniobacter flavus]
MAQARAGGGFFDWMLGVSSGTRNIIAAFFLAVVVAHAEEFPDITTVSPDLTVPEMTAGSPEAGKRVRYVTPGWEGTEVYGALYLPVDWKPAGRYPVIVEWAGNGDFHDAFGDVSTGVVEGSRLGYGVREGKGCIWICVPYLNNAGTANVIKWWGDPPTFDPEPTLKYCRATVQNVCEKFGGDPQRVVLAGFSRGSIACNYLGLHDDATAVLWRGFICYSHYDGVRTNWPYPAADQASALVRLQRLKGRPQFICGERGNAAETERYLRETGSWDKGTFTVVGTGFRNHNDAWTLRPSEARTKLRAWFHQLVDSK